MLRQLGQLVVPPVDFHITLFLPEVLLRQPIFHTTFCYNSTHKNLLKPTENIPETKVLNDNTTHPDP